MAECARQLVLEPYLVLLNDVRSSSQYVRSMKIFFNSFSALINQLPSCFVLYFSSRVCSTRLALLTFVYCAFDMIQLKRYIIIRNLDKSDEQRVGANSLYANADGEREIQWSLPSA